MLLAALTFLAGLALAGLLLALSRHRLAVRKRVLVNLRDGKALSGVLWARHTRLLVLRGVTLLEPGAEPAPVDGEVLVERQRIDFIQAIGG